MAVKREYTRHNVRLNGRIGPSAYRYVVIEMLGGRCRHEGCDVSDPIMLDVAHTHDDGANHRKMYAQDNRPTHPGSSVRYYLSIIEAIRSGSDEYVLLCANHHRLWDYEKRQQRKAAIV